MISWPELINIFNELGHVSLMDLTRKLNLSPVSTFTGWRFNKLFSTD